MAAEIKWLNHASFRLAGESVVYIDPWKIAGRPGDGNVVFVSHAHYDHCSADDVKKVAAVETTVLASADAAGQLGGQPLKPGQTVELAGVKITAVPAYNIGKAFHSKANGWLGAVVEIGGVRVYYAGDTDRIPEMAELADIDVALLPVGGTYTMDAAEAALAAADIRPKAAVPYHFGDIVGSVADAKRFAEAAGCTVHVLEPGEAVSIERGG